MDEEKEPQWRNVGGKRRKIISYVKSPLGFFALALLIVESFLFGGGKWFDLSETMRIVTIGTGVVLFLVVIGVVTMLAVKYPQALVFSEHSHLEWEYMHVFGDNSRPFPDRTIIVQKGIEPPDRPNQPGVQSASISTSTDAGEK